MQHSKNKSWLSYELRYAHSPPQGTWVLAEGFNSFLKHLLHSPSWPSQGRVAMLQLLAYGAKEDDVVLILHMDRWGQLE